MIRSSLICLALLSACHDARRSSPLDPELTPATSLQATLADSTGHVELTWQPYAGTTELAAWWVLRNEAESRVIDTLATLAGDEHRAFRDTNLAPDTRYEYRVSAVNVDGFEAASTAIPVAGFSLSPVSDLRATPDAARALVRLTWPAYSGPGFESYRLIRREVGTDRSDTLSVLREAGEIAFEDTSARHGLTYSYWLQARAAGQVLESVPVEARLLLAPPVVESLTFESSEAEATLTWQPYAGPHFGRYVISRRVEGETATVLASIEDVAETAFTDRALLGDLTYTYELSVETARSESITATQTSGAFHRLVDTWEVEIDPDGALADTFRAQSQRWIDSGRSLLQDFERNTGPPVFIRLHGEAQGVGAHISIPNAPAQWNSQLDWRTYRRDGDLQDMVHLAQLVADGSLFDQITRTSRTNTITSVGDTILVGVLDPISGGLEIRQADGHGQGRYREDILLEVPLTSPASARPSTGTVHFQGENYPFASVETDGDEVYRFHQLVDPIVDSLVTLPKGWFEMRVRFEHQLRFPALDLQTFRSGISVGADTLGRLSYWVNQDVNGGWLDLEWSWTDPQDSMSTSTETATTPWRSLGLVHQHFVLEARGGVGRLLDVGPTFARAAVDNDATTVSMAPLADGFALAVGRAAYFLGADGGEPEETHRFDSRVTEVRTWRNRLGTQVGVALPDERKVLVGRASASNWAAGIQRTSLGPILPVEPGTMLYPISFDVGPDGRFYVLDAGTNRVYVFDASRRYITHFGTKGDGPGQFDFGTWGLDDYGDPGLSGSIAVDDDGYIYVADDGQQQRVQVFAP